MADNITSTAPDFSPSATMRAVHDTLDQAAAAIPDGKDGALLIDGTRNADGTGTADILIATRVGKDWTFVTGGSYDGHQFAGKVALQGSWNWHKPAAVPATAAQLGVHAGSTGE